MFSNFLKQCNVFITTHQSVADTLVNCYSFLQDKIKIIEHGRDLKVLKNKNILKDKITIIVPGTITYAKGLKEVQKLKELDVNNLFVIHYFSDVEYNIGIRHSLYNRENLSTLIKDIQPEIALVLSIWNETYCHVLTEMWNCNIPTICFNFETQKQRTLANEGGFVCENIIEVYNLLKTREFNCNMQLKNVSIKCMSKQYLNVYCGVSTTVATPPVTDQSYVLE